MGRNHIIQSNKFRRLLSLDFLSLIYMLLSSRKTAFLLYIMSFVSESLNSQISDMNGRSAAKYFISFARFEIIRNFFVRI